ncbi:MAG: hypothetical protein Q4C25_01055 [Bacillota bacterium]|nr:hypothetical protein [Bacillota bacterium]
MTKASETPAQASAIKIDGNVTIQISGNVNLQGAVGGAGIEVPATSDLTVRGAGSNDSLTAVGNGGINDTSTGGSGIGNVKTIPTTGNITITDINSIAAKGYGSHAAGIGGNEGDITISNVNSVIAHGSFPNEVPEEWGDKRGEEAGAGIGGASISGNTGNINISDTVLTQVYGGNKSAAIGTACWGDMKAGCSIQITGCRIGEIIGGTSGAGIGLGRYNNDATQTADIVINNCTMLDGGMIEGGQYGSGIGTGYSPNYGSKVEPININILNSTLNTAGGEAAAAIGSGYRFGKYNINIANSSIYAKAGVYDENGKPQLIRNGANAIGGGAYGSHLPESNDYAKTRYSDSSLSIDAASNITAISNGGKWAIGTENSVDTSGIDNNILQVRYLTDKIQEQATGEEGYFSEAYGYEKDDADCEIIDETKENTVMVGGESVTLPAGYRSVAVTVGSAGDYTTEGSAVKTPYASYAAPLEDGKEPSDYTTAGLKANDFTANALFAVAGLSSYDYVAYRAGTENPIPTPDPEPGPTTDPTPTTPSTTPTDPTTPARTTGGGAVTAIVNMADYGVGDTATIEDEPAALANIEDEATPRAAGQDHWALLNLLLTIFTAALGIALIALYFTKKRRDEERYEGDELAQMDSEDNRVIKRRGIPRILSGIWAIAMVIVFFLTEDMSLPMQFTDEWTWLMVIMAIMQLAIAVVCKKQYDDKDDYEEYYN